MGVDMLTGVQAVMLGCAGETLTPWERAFFRDANPLGFILFKRNCRESRQVQALVVSLRDAVGRDAPVLIDQEGGRVQRLKPPAWPQFPPARSFGDLAARDPALAEEAVAWWATAIALELRALGIDADATPVLDLPIDGASDVIGDRAFGTEPALVARLGRVVCAALLRTGVLPVIKHLPGHGRAREDSHMTLPVVDADVETLATSDFAPFAALADQPWGMTAHVVYAAIDPTRPATLSAPVIAQVIRDRIGFDGLLLSDDLSMDALSGPLEARASGALDAGCDVALHCTGDPAEMLAVSAAVGALTDAAKARVARADALRQAAVAAAADADATSAALRARVDAVLASS